MQTRLNLMRIMAAALVLVFAGGLQIAAQESIGKGVFWSDRRSGIKVYLFDDGRLMVISKRGVKVEYHTKINSTIPVDKKLIQNKSDCGMIRYFKVDHTFSKTTIWMTLEFTIGGKKIRALTRTFYNSIFEVVPTDEFYPDGKK